MKLVNWRYAFASVAGSSHEKNGVGCQDASACRIIQTGNGEAVLIAAVSDGAGSANFSGLGSALACDLFIDGVDDHFQCRRTPEELGEQFAREWVQQFQQAIARKAVCCQAKPRDFACTILTAVVGTDWAVFMQVGDGAIVTSLHDNSESYDWIFWPDNGEFANSTYFATESAAHKNIRIIFQRKIIDRVALFTDGMQRLTLHYESKTAFQPFFRPIFEELNSASNEQMEKMNLNLAAFLKSPDVNARSDDDKTLIIASRRGE